MADIDDAARIVPTGAAIVNSCSYTCGPFAPQVATGPKHEDAKTTRGRGWKWLFRVGTIAMMTQATQTCNTDLRPPPIAHLSDHPGNVLVRPETVPSALTAIPAWVVSGPDKIPHTPTTRRRADPTNPRAGGTFTEALAALGAGFDRVGFVLDPARRIVALDFDQCVDPVTGAVDPDVQADVDALDTYTETSPSGRGLRVFAYADGLPDGWRKGDRVEAYAGSHYVSVTGDVYQGRDQIEERTAELRAWHQRRAPKRTRPPAPQPSTPLARDPETILRLVLNTRKGQRLHVAGDIAGYASASEADLGLVNLYQAAGADRTQADDLFRGSALFREKWDERHRADGRSYGTATLDRSYDGSVRALDVPTGEGTHTASATPADLTALPDDVGQLKALVVDLTKRVEAAETRAKAAEVRAAELSALQSRTMSVMRSRTLGAEKLTGLALAFELASQQAAHPDQDEFVIPYLRLADQSGQHESTVASHVKVKLEPLGLFKRRTRYVSERVDPTTGELFPAKTQTLFRPLVDPLAMLDALATAQHASGKPKGNHGGKANRGSLRPCPDHPGAAIIHRVSFHCAQCDALLGGEPDELLPEAPNGHLACSVNDGPNGHLACSVNDGAALPPTPPKQTRVVNHYRASPGLTYHNVQPSPAVPNGSASPPVTDAELQRSLLAWHGPAAGSADPYDVTLGRRP